MLSIFQLVISKKPSNTIMHYITNLWLLCKLILRLRNLISLKCQHFLRISRLLVFLKTGFVYLLICPSMQYFSGGDPSIFMHECTGSTIAFNFGHGFGLALLLPHMQTFYFYVVHILFR